LRVTLLAAISLVALTALSSLSSAAGFDAGDLRLKILSADRKATIGYTRFTVLQKDSTEEIKGETTYVDGERDSENELLDVAAPAYTPRLETYKHSFFNADGTLSMVDMLDAKSGVASCASYTSGKMKMRKAQLEVPADSFAGASGLMMMVGNLRHGNRDIRFHAFACAPGPEIFSVMASLPVRAERWPFYSGDLFRIDMRPDLGALNLLVAPFMPTMDAWFSPADNWNYVGGEFDRYFRGPHVLTVRVPPAD
jgi:hypothetical protein